MKRDQIKSITEDLLKQLNESMEAKGGERVLSDELSRHESETSSMADEKEISHKLQQILRLLNEKGEEKKQEEEEKEIDYKKQMVQDVCSEGVEGHNDLELYVIKADEVDGEATIEDEELKRFFDSEIETEEETERQMGEVIAKAESFKPINRHDDHRALDASPYGGFQLLDKELTSRMRSAGKELIKQVGKKILSGQFNLTTISFPIKCMCSKSILHAVGSIGCVFPYYLNAAALKDDPVERMKIVMVSTIAFLFPTHMFEKPVILLHLMALAEPNPRRNPPAIL